MEAQRLARCRHRCVCCKAVGAAAAAGAAAGLPGLGASASVECSPCVHGGAHVHSCQRGDSGSVFSSRRPPSLFASSHPWPPEVLRRRLRGGVGRTAHRRAPVAVSSRLRTRASPSVQPPLELRTGGWPRNRQDTRGGQGSIGCIRRQRVQPVAARTGDRRRPAGAPAIGPADDAGDAAAAAAAAAAFRLARPHASPLAVESGVHAHHADGQHASRRPLAGLGA
eukprot:349850-Chlamydomonas_euryale.AAC.15